MGLQACTTPSSFKIILRHWIPAKPWTTYLDVATVVASGRELDSAEGDGALQGHLDSCLLYPILSVGPRGARDGTAAKVPLYYQ